VARSKARLSVIRVPQTRPSSPIIKVSVPRAAPVARRPKRHHRRKGASSGSGRSIVTFAIGGAAVGFIEKQNLPIPTIPMLGKKGTIAVLAYFWAKNGGPKIMWDIALAGAVLSGYQLAKDGRIDGDDE